jgi:hypothetical protein
LLPAPAARVASNNHFIAVGSPAPR